MWRPWPEGDVALALAALEELDPAAAVARLAPLFAERPDDVELGEVLARAHRAAGEASSELAVLRVLAAHAPLPRPVRRRYCLALAAAGETDEARRVGADLLAADPDDEELGAALGAGD